MTDPRTALLDKDRPSWLADPKAEREAELSPEQTGPREKRRSIFKLTRRFDWSELWEKVWGRG